MKLKSPLLDNCCCCVSNRTAAITFAYLSLVGYSLLIVGCLVEMGFGITYHHIYSSVPSSRDRNDLYVGFAMIFAGVPTFLVSILGIVFTVILINGIYRRKMHYIIPWLTMQAYACVYTFGFIICVLIANVTLISAIGVPLLMILLGVQIYCTLVVFSFYQETKKEFRHVDLEFQPNAFNVEI